MRVRKILLSIVVFVTLMGQSIPISAMTTSSEKTVVSTDTKQTATTAELAKRKSNTKQPTNDPAVTPNYSKKINETSNSTSILEAMQFHGEGIPGKTIPILGVKAKSHDLCTFFGIPDDAIINVLKAHEKDNYFLTTPYRGLATNPDEDMYLSPNGDPTKYGPGMNCTGFVATVCARAGGDISRIRNNSTGFGGVANAYNWRDVLRQTVDFRSYTSIPQMLNSGQLSKGDVIFFDPDTTVPNYDAHIGFFWGDSPSDNKFWHSFHGGNMISEIKEKTPSQKIYLFKEYIPPEKGNVKIKKVDSYTGKALANAKFKLSYSGRMTELLTNASGEAELKDIQDGTKVTILEVTAPNGYVITKTPQTVTVAADQTKTVTFKDKAQLGQLTIHKQDKETGDKTQGAATLNGTVFGLYTSAGKKVQDITIQKLGSVFQGVAKNLKLGSYYIKEEKAPAGYLLDSTKISFSIDYAGQDKNVSLKTETAKDQVIKGALEGYKFADRPLVDKVTAAIKAKLQRKDNDTSKTPLKGVEITATAKTTGKKYKSVTDKNGHFKIDQLPYDAYHVEETKGLEGYLLFDPFDVIVKDDGYVFHYLLEDRVIQSTLQVVKKDKESGKTIPQAGATFKIWDRWANDKKGDWVWMTKPNDTEKTDEFMTNKKGYLVTSEMLRFGKDRYDLYEVKAPAGYQLATDPVNFSITEKDADKVIVLDFKDDVQKGQVKIHKNVQTGTSIEKKTSPYGDYSAIQYSQQNGEGFTFKVRAAADIITPDGTVHQKKGEIIKDEKGNDLELTTDKDGDVKSPPILYLGKCELLETHAPMGVVPLKETQPFELTYAGQTVDVTSTTVTIDNPLQKIHVRGHKDQEVLRSWKDNQPVIETEAANGQVFGLYTDQELTVGTDVLPKDSCLGYATVKGGVFTYDGYLLAGDFYFKEVDAGNDHVLDEKQYPFTYTPKDNEEEVTIDVWGNKQDAPDKVVDTSKPLTIITAPGPKVEPGEPILNKLYHTDVPFRKIVETATIAKNGTKAYSYSYDKEATGAGAVFELKDAKKKEIQRVTTDKKGAASWKDLPVGNYTMQETKAPSAHYLIDTEVFHIAVTKEAVILTNAKGKQLIKRTASTKSDATPLFTVKDPLKKGTVKVKKQDSRTNQALKGATIQVLDDKNHVLATKETDRKGQFEVTNLPLGTYHLKETKAPGGYEYQKRETTVELKKDKVTVAGSIKDVHLPILQSGIHQPREIQWLACGVLAMLVTTVVEYIRQRRIKKGHEKG